MTAWTLLSRCFAMLSVEFFLWSLLLALGCYMLGTSALLVWREHRRNKGRELLSLRVRSASGDLDLYDGPNVAAKWWRESGRKRKHKRA